MKRDTYPSEAYTCTRCGLARVRNAGLKRRARSTGLCRDCFLATEWTCPVCDRTMSAQAAGIHMMHSHKMTLN